MNAARLLSQADLSGTFYVSMQKLANHDFFTREDLEWLYANKHEIGCHTFSHKSMRFMSAKSIKSELISNQQAIRKILPGYQFENFAYPFGIAPIFRDRIILDNFKSVRGISHGINTDRFNLSNLKVIKFYESLHSAETIKIFLEKTRELNGWVIFYTHGVEKNYNKYSCSTEYFQKILHFSLISGFEILSVSEVVNSKLIPY